MTSRGGIRRSRPATPDERVVVEPALPFSLGFASMHASPPMEKTPVRSVYRITEPPLDMPKAEADAWLERYNYASLENTSAHEAMPGHWLHSIYMRRTPGKVRRIWIGLNPFPQPSSGQDGWAHYAEQMVLDEGFANNDPRYRLAQLSDALTRICRLLSGIRVHTKQWSLEDAQRCLRIRRTSLHRRQNARLNERFTIRRMADTSWGNAASSSCARITRQRWERSSTCANFTNASCRTASHQFAHTGL
jgi:hypothetical protein